MQTFLTILNNWTTTAKSVLIARIWCIARRCIKKLNEIRRIRPVSFCDKYGISALFIKPANCRYNKVNNHYFLNGNSNWKLLKLLTSCVRLFEYVSFQYQYLQMHSYPQFLQSTFYCRDLRVHSCWKKQKTKSDWNAWVLLISFRHITQFTRTNQYFLC